MNKLEAYKTASQKMTECKDEIMKVLKKVAEAERAMEEVGQDILEETEKIFQLQSKAWLEATKLEQVYEAMARVYEMMKEQK